MTAHERGLLERALSVIEESDDAEEHDELIADLRQAGSSATEGMCKRCGNAITKEIGGVWIDETGGDGCGSCVHAPLPNLLTLELFVAHVRNIFVDDRDQWVEFDSCADVVEWLTDALVNSGLGAENGDAACDTDCSCACHREDSKRCKECR